MTEELACIYHIGVSESPGLVVDTWHVKNGDNGSLVLCQVLVFRFVAYKCSKPTSRLLAKQRQLEFPCTIRSTCWPLICPHWTGIRKVCNMQRVYVQGHSSIHPCTHVTTQMCDYMCTAAVSVSLSYIFYRMLYASTCDFRAKKYSPSQSRRLKRKANF